MSHLAVGFGQACNLTAECLLTSLDLTCQEGICNCKEGMYNSAFSVCSESVWTDVATAVLRFFLISFTIFITSVVLYVMFSHTVSSRWLRCRGRGQSSVAADTADAEVTRSAASEQQDKPPSYEDIEQKPPSYQHAIEMEKSCKSEDVESPESPAKKPPDSNQEGSNDYVLHI